MERDRNGVRSGDLQVVGRGLSPGVVKVVVAWPVCERGPERSFAWRGFQFLFLKGGAIP